MTLIAVKKRCEHYDMRIPELLLGLENVDTARTCGITAVIVFCINLMLF
jgi:hypothetical protein